MRALHEYFLEYALLFATALPILVVLGANLWLWLGGERGTLALPSSRPFPSAEPAPAKIIEPVLVLTDLRLDADDEPVGELMASELMGSDSIFDNEPRSRRSRIFENGV